MFFFELFVFFLNSNQTISEQLINLSYYTGQIIKQ